MSRRTMLGLFGSALAGTLCGCASPIAGQATPVLGSYGPGDGGVAAGSEGRARTVYVAAGANLTAVDAESGSPSWTARLTENSSMPGPASVGPDGLYCLDDGGFVSRWSLDDGRQLARIRVGTDGLSDTVPLVLGNRVFIDNWTGDVVVLDADTLQEAQWTYRSGSTDRISASPVGTGDTVFFSSPSGYVIAFAAGDGRRRWATQVPAGELLPASDLLITSNSSTLLALHQDDGTVSWQQPVVGAGSPTVSDGNIFVTADGRLCSFTAADGTPGWTQSADESTDALQGQPAVTGSVVCCLYQAYTYASSSVGVYSGTNSYLAGFDRNTGKRLWHNRNVFPSAAPVAVGGRIYVAANYVGGGAPQDVLCCLDAASGALVWHTPVPAAVDAPPTVVTDRGIVMAYGGSF